MSYKIKIFYETGDSINTENCTTDIEGEWNNLSIVEENMRRIQGHYEWYTSIKSTYRKNPNNVKKPDYVRSEYSLKFLLDDGKEYDYSPFWVGYFETLYSAEVIEVKCLPKYTPMDYWK